jgi:type I restriction enzyme, S subunit
MSSDWREVQLSDLITVKHGFAFKGEHFTDAATAYQLVTPGNFSIGKGFQLGKGKYYDGPVPSDYVLRRGDVVVTMTDLSKAADTLGFAAVIPETQGTTWLHNQRVGLVEVRPDAQVTLGYIHYLMRTSEYRHWVVSSATGSTVKHTAPSRVCSYRFKLPRLFEQDAIAATLGALDDRITLLRETNATLEAIAQALFKSWFVDFDPVRARMEGRAPEGMDEATAALFPDGFEESELGLVPRGWRSSSLAALISQAGGNIQTGPFGSQLHASDYVIEGVPVVMPKDISLRRVQIDSIARISPVDVERLARHKLVPGDIVFSRRGDVERHALISETERGWLCGTGCLLVRPGKKWLSPTFLSMLLDAPQARTWLVQHAVGATMPNLNTGILGSVPVVQPPDGLLHSFEHVVSTLEKSRAENSAQAQTLATLRDTLLPRLISGQLRLPAAKSLIEESVA